MSNITLTRRRNALALFQAYAERMFAAGAPPKGLEQAFAGVLQISPSMWSQIKSSRPIGDKLARQIEKHCARPAGWLDEVHGVAVNAARNGTAEPASTTSAPETCHALVLQLRAEATQGLAQHLQARGWTQTETARALGVPAALAAQLLAGSLQDANLEWLLTLSAQAGLRPALRWS